MKLKRAAGLAGIAKVVYDQARKPENQARIRAAVEKVRERRARSSAGGTGTGTSAGSSRHAR